MGCVVFILGAMLIVGFGLAGWWWVALVVVALMLSNR